MAGFQLYGEPESNSYKKKNNLEKYMLAVCEVITAEEIFKWMFTIDIRLA